MNLIDRIYMELENKMKCNQPYQNERLVLLMQKERMPMEKLARGGVQKMLAEAELANVTIPNYQVAVDRAFVGLPMVYGQALKRMLLHTIQDRIEVGGSAKQHSLEEDCMQLMTEYAMERFEHVMRPMPDGVRVYPVTIHPSDWEDNLESGFSNIDRMQSSQMYMAEYVKVFLSRERLVKVLLRYGRLVESKKVYEKIDKLQHEIGSMHPWFGIFKEPDKVPEVTWKRLQNGVLPHAAGKKQATKQVIYDNITEKQEVYGRYEESLWEWTKDTSKSRFLQEIKAEMKVLQRRLSELRTQIQLSMMKDEHESELEYNLLPHIVDNAYETIVLTGTVEELYEESELCCEDTLYSTGLNALFAGNVPYGIEEKNINGHLGIEIGFLARRLEIEREWFMPQVLQNIESAWLTAYPSSLIIVQDITIRFIFDQISLPMIPIFMKCVYQNRGFLCFHERYQSRKGLCSVGGNILTCRFDWPQLAGYYMIHLQ